MPKRKWTVWSYEKIDATIQEVRGRLRGFEEALDKTLDPAEVRELESLIERAYRTIGLLQYAKVEGDPVTIYEDSRTVTSLHPAAHLDRPPQGEISVPAEVLYPERPEDRLSSIALTLYATYRMIAIEEDDRAARGVASTDWLAARLGVSVPAVNKAIARLKELGWLTIGSANAQSAYGTGLREYTLLLSRREREAL